VQGSIIQGQGLLAAEHQKDPKGEKTGEVGEKEGSNIRKKIGVEKRVEF